MKKNTCVDDLILGEIVMIGVAEAAHLTALLLGWTFARCTMLFWGLAGAMCVLEAGSLLIRGHTPAGNAPIGKRTLAGNDGGKISKGRHQGRLLPETMPERILAMVFALLFLSQLIFICMGHGRYRQGDMTVETVGSFLVADGIYQVNPMTGMSYTEGIPSRLKILCLPTLYGSLCRISGFAPAVIVQGIVPVATLCSCYAAYASLGRCLFPDSGCAEGKKRICFLIVVSLLLWAGTYLSGMDGFNLLRCGWRGVDIRNGVLLPWLLSLCLRRKWLSAFLCILAEACMVWTFYGMGVCLFVAVGMAAADLCCGKVRKLSAKSLPGADGKENDQ